MLARPSARYVTDARYTSVSLIQNSHSPASPRIPTLRWSFRKLGDTFRASPPGGPKGPKCPGMCHPPVVRRGPGSDLVGANRVEQLCAELEELLVQALGEDVGDVVLGVSLV